MKEPIQKSQQPAQESQQEKGGLSMSPPEFSLSAGPVQAKMSGNQPVQMKNDRTPEQEKLRQDFEAYRDLKGAQITDMGVKSTFVAKANSFIEWADKRSGWFNGDQRWGNDDYKKKLKSDFTDYVSVLQGKIAELKGVALADAEAALLTAKGSLAAAQIAVEQASTNTAAAEKAAAEAESEAIKAETAATNAEANAKLPDAGEPEKAAAVKAREAATAARAAADAAKKAVEAAKASQELASEQKSFAAAQISQAEAVISSTKGITDLQSAYRQQKGNASLKKGTETAAAGIKSNSEASLAAKNNAEGSASTAKTEATKAKTEEMNSKPIPGLTDKIKELDGLTDKKARKAKAKELITLARAEIAKYPPKIATYKDQPTPDSSEKVRVIGQLAATAARVEWLIGSIYLEGSGDKNKWKGNGLTKDEEKLLGNYYESSVGAESSGVWCTAFLGTVYKTVAGLKNNKGKDPNGELWSGYKVGRHGKEASFDYSADQGGQHVGRSEGKKDESFVTLHKEIVKNKDDKAKREELVDQFFTDHFKPQAGDVMIVKRSTNKTANSFTDKGYSHTTMVERLDGHKIYTIEGNAGNRVQGRVYDLTDPDDSGKIVYISRLSLNNFGEKPDPKKPALPFAGPEVSEAELLGPINKLATALTAFAQTKGYINSLAEGQLDVVNNLKQGGGATGPGE
ncbi:MAG: CHAP domain-containing protein [Bacteroidetes bacterium]|nr:CHAP domain-containing protein [Bacteroidota bacterium]